MPKKFPPEFKRDVVRVHSVLGPYATRGSGVNATYRRALAASVGEGLAASLDVNRPELWLQALLEPVLARQAQRDDAAVLSGALPETWWRPHVQMKVFTASPKRFAYECGVRLVSSEGDLSLSCYPLSAEGLWEWDGLVRFIDVERDVWATSDVRDVLRAADALHAVAVRAGMEIHAGRGSRGPFAAKLSGAHPPPPGLWHLVQLPPAAPLPLAPPVGPADPYTLYPWLLEPALRGHPDVRMSWHHDSGYARSSWDLWAPGRGGLSIIRDDTGYRWDGLSSVYRDMDRLSVQELSPDAVMTAVHLWLAGPPWASA